MSTLSALYHLARADFLERIRRYSFLLTLAASLYLGLAVVQGQLRLFFGLYRGVQTSAWVGLQMAMCAVTFVSLAGFYVVKGSVNRDQETRVGQILASTPIHELDYLFGKALSNLAVLALIVVVLIVAATAGQLWAGEDSHLQLWQLVSPFLFITLPAFACVGCLAVLFETLPWLRGGFGNILYFFLWIFLLVAGLELKSSFADFAGIGWLESVAKLRLSARYPDYDGGVSIGVLSGHEASKTFFWPGIEWHLDLVSIRLYWLAVGMILILIAAAFFDRFDPARAWFHRPPPAHLPRRRFFRWWRNPRSEQTQPEAAKISPGENGGAAAQLTPLETLPTDAGWTPLCLAELRIMLKGQSWWWYLGAAGLLIASLATPAGNSRETLLPLVWIWPVLIWSAMGTREARFQTDQLVFSSANTLRQQFPAAWLAGVMVAMLMGSGVVFRLALARDWSGLSAFVVSAAFIPTLALALGVWTGTSKLFEAVYVIWWYIGPLQHGGAMDFMFTSARGSLSSAPQAYLMATFILFAFACLGRRRQVLA